MGRVRRRGIASAAKSHFQVLAGSALPQRAHYVTGQQKTGSLPRKCPGPTPFEPFGGDGFVSWGCVRMVRRRAAAASCKGRDSYPTQQNDRCDIATAACVQIRLGRMLSWASQAIKAACRALKYDLARRSLDRGVGVEAHLSPKVASPCPFFAKPNISKASVSVATQSRLSFRPAPLSSVTPVLAKVDVVIPGVESDAGGRQFPRKVWIGMGTADHG